VDTRDYSTSSAAVTINLTAGTGAGGLLYPAPHNLPRMTSGFGKADSHYSSVVAARCASRFLPFERVIECGLFICGVFSDRWPGW
jgi:hypothetical protein